MDYLIGSKLKISGWLMDCIEEPLEKPVHKKEAEGSKLTDSTKFSFKQ